MGKKNWLLWLNECKQFLQQRFFSKKQDSPPVSPPPVVVDAKELKTIVVVEDNALLRKRYVDILTAFHYDVVEANNNAEAIHFLKTVEKDVHLLITNIERKDGNAFELLSNLHTCLPYYIPVVLISAQIENYQSEIKQAKECIGVKYIVSRQKPTTRRFLYHDVYYSLYPCYTYFPSPSFLEQVNRAKVINNDFPGIMLIDDDPNVLSKYESMLMGLPYNVFVFKEGLSALFFLGSSPVKIDLILTNIKMPYLDAYYLFEEVHKFIDYPISALVITSLFNPNLKNNFMHRKYKCITLVDVLPKPIDYTTFHKAICKALPTKAIKWMN
jgi:CheY-like chemotaxis protein